MTKDLTVLDLSVDGIHDWWSRHYSFMVDIQLIFSEWLSGDLPEEGRRALMLRRIEKFEKRHSLPCDADTFLENFCSERGLL